MLSVANLRRKAEDLTWVFNLPVDRRLQRGCFARVSFQHQGLTSPLRKLRRPQSKACAFSDPHNCFLDHTSKRTALNGIGWRTACLGTRGPEYPQQLIALLDTPAMHNLNVSLLSLLSCLEDTSLSPRAGHALQSSQQSCRWRRQPPIETCFSQTHRACMTTGIPK